MDSEFTTVTRKPIRGGSSSRGGSRGGFRGGSQNGSRGGGYRTESRYQSRDDDDENWGKTSPRGNSSRGGSSRGGSSRGGSTNRFAQTLPPSSGKARQQNPFDLLDSDSNDSDDSSSSFDSNDSYGSISSTSSTSSTSTSSDLRQSSRMSLRVSPPRNTPTKVLPKTVEEVEKIVSSMKKDGSFNAIKHLKTFNSLSELGPLVLSDEKNCVVGGPTGSGKTIGTLVFLLTMFATYAWDGTVYFSIPLRKGVENAFKYVKQLVPTFGYNIGWAAGGEVHYNSTQKLRVCTTQHVFNRLAKLLVTDSERQQLNNMLVIVDEAHSPTSENFLLIALCLHIQNLGYTLRMVIMSATLDSAPLLNEFSSAPKVELEGRLFPLEIIHSDSMPDEKEVHKKTIECVVKCARDGKNCLVFVAGQEDIDKLTSELESYSYMDVCSLISNMPDEEMKLAFQPVARGKKVKIIISTNMAESSLTLDNIDVVIDTGYEIKAVKAPSGRGTQFIKQFVSVASANQRAGRAARVRPGTCYRMWTQSHEMYSMQLHSKSDIHSIDPDVQTLRLHSYGLPAQQIIRLEDDRYNEMTERHHRLGLIERISEKDIKRGNPTEWKITQIGSRVLDYQTSLDTSVGCAHLADSDDNTVRIVGTYILSLIEGCGGYLPFWISKEKRKDLVKNGFDDSDFGDFKGEDDIETLFLIIFGENGMLSHEIHPMTETDDGMIESPTKFTSHSSEPLTYANATSFHDISKLRRVWAKKSMMNLKQIKNSMRIFQQSISTMFGKGMKLPEHDCFKMIDPRIFDPTEYDYIESVLQEIRTSLAKIFIGECYEPTLIRNNMFDVEPGFKDNKNLQYRFDRRRSYCKMGEQLNHLNLKPIFPFNISILGGGKRFVSAIMIDPNPKEKMGMIPKENVEVIPRYEEYERSHSPLLSTQVFNRFIADTDSDDEGYFGTAPSSQSQFYPVSSYPLSTPAYPFPTYTTPRYPTYQPEKKKEEPIFAEPKPRPHVEWKPVKIVLNREEFTNLGGWK